MKNIVHIPVLKSENRSVNYTNHTAVCTGHSVVSANHTVTLTFLAHKDRLSCRHPQVSAALFSGFTQKRKPEVYPTEGQAKSLQTHGSDVSSDRILSTGDEANKTPSKKFLQA